MIIKREIANVRGALIQYIMQTPIFLLMRLVNLAPRSAVISHLAHVLNQSASPRSLPAALPGPSPAAPAGVLRPSPRGLNGCDPRAARRVARSASATPPIKPGALEASAESAPTSLAARRAARALCTAAACVVEDATEGGEAAEGEGEVGAGDRR